MAGTRHFSRMKYHVERGLREIVAPRQILPEAGWLALLATFNSKCVFCDQEATMTNRGLVADHLIPANAFGELVLGNALPACQHCNDSRGKVEWATYVRQRFPGDAEAQILRIADHLARYSYQACGPTINLLPEELAEYEKLRTDFDDWLRRANALRNAVVKRLAPSR